MLTVDDYGAIRRARRDGKSIRRVALDFDHSRNTIRYVLKHPEPGSQTRNRNAPVLGPFQAVIDQVLADNEDAPHKQRHTAAQVFRRLRDEHGYHGCYGQVQRYLRKHHRPHRETFIPLGHLPGHRLEADFGPIYVDFPDGRRQVPFLVAAWADSNASFVIALPCERTAAILHGRVAAFEFFGAVAKEVWWDNPKTVATLVLKGRERQLHRRSAALASHYVFDPCCCMPARGNEKPDAEGTVKAVQRRFATPVPRVAERDELNRFFRFSVLPQLSKPKILELSRCEWIEHKHNCCLVGNHGTGKTHIAVALGQAACRAGLRVLFFTAAELVSKLEAAQKQYTWTASWANWSERSS